MSMLGDKLKRSSNRSNKIEKLPTTALRSLARALRESDYSDEEQRDTLAAEYSDRYKELYDIRPRWMTDKFSSMSIEQIQSELDDLKREADEAEESPQAPSEDLGVDPYETLPRSSGMGRGIREAAGDEKVESGEDSLDAQIDKYLADYEAEAKNSKNEGLDYRMMARRFLREAEEDEKKEEDKAEEASADEPEKLTAEDLDMKSFVGDVVRLVDNYDSLLEVRNTILRRAVNHLVKNYEGDVAEAFKEELLESYGMEIGKTKADEEDELQPPKAGAAGPVGGGGA